MKIIRRISILFFSIAIIILIPFLFEYFVFSKSNTISGEFSNFLGEYIGSIISILGVLITVYFSNKKINEQLEKTNEQITLQKEEIEEQKRSKNEQHRLNNLPILDVKIVEVLKEPEDNSFGFSLVEYESFQRKNIVEKSLTAKISISNIGIGPAIDLKYTCESENFKGNGICWNNSIKTLKSNEETTHCFSFYYPLLNFVPDKKTASEYKFDLIIYYKDILGNSYAKTTQLEFFTDDYITDDENPISNWLRIVDEDLGKLEENPLEKRRKQAEFLQKQAVENDD